MIIQIGTEVDESRILWKHNEKDEWKRADIDELIDAYESIVRCKDCFWFDQNIYRNCFRNRSEDEYAEWGVCTKLSHNMKVNDYCSCGEREAPYKGGDTE